MRRVILFRNGTNIDGKVVMLHHSIEDLLATASKRFNINAEKLFTSQGGEIDDVQLIRDDDILYISAGEPFIFFQDGMWLNKEAKVNNKQYSISSASVSNPDWVLLNVGGRYFSTTRSTLTTKEPQSMLARMFAKEDGSMLWSSQIDNNGAFLLDRSPIYFEPLLNYLRHGQLVLDKGINPQGVLEEAKFFGIESVISTLEALILEEQGATDHTPLTRREVMNALIGTSHTSELRFQGVNLSGGDLSKLDLRHINFKYANMRGSRLTGANLSFCCLERAELSYANLEGAVLAGVKMLCANLEGADMRSCNMEDPAGTRANLEGVNLKGANLEGSQMSGVNLRVATLKHANLQNCDLRGAVLAGADLECCDLSGSDLHEANLRGANLKDTAFELMLTPLHMSQVFAD